MDVTLTAGVTLIYFLNKSLDTLKLIQKDDPSSTEMQLHLATLTQQLSLTMVEASQLNGILAQKTRKLGHSKQSSMNVNLFNMTTQPKCIGLMVMNLPFVQNVTRVITS
ncbi:hypothetical protein Q9F35_005122 [Vibrio harveyi]|uniref:hypothetical protein n=1 Tax=Vibrio harveyi TaxID=669 RepID=UPI00068108DA|nr:hypothetical protein [Vibrio harveyi]ELH7813260.1 hypothetical protein [Vibrio harveyi]